MTPAKAVSWQPHEDERLRAGWPQESISIIAKALDRTRSSVIGRAHRLGLPRKPPPLVMLPRPPPLPRPPKAAVTAAPPHRGTGNAPENKSLFELALWDCRWPIGDPRDGDFAFCAAPALRPFGYCAHHQRMNFNSR